MKSSWPGPARSCCPPPPPFHRSSNAFPPAPASKTGYGRATSPFPSSSASLHVRSLEGFGLVGHEPAAVAAGVVLHYVRTTQKNDALHIDSLRFQEHSTALELDQVTVRNLELVEPLFAGQFGDSSDRATLFHTLDACSTPMGKRLLRATILRPLMDTDFDRIALRSRRRSAQRSGQARGNPSRLLRHPRSRTPSRPHLS